jgi:8-oxo-dGTP pyrophosphatase MutT (NUDIX family)
MHCSNSNKNNTASGKKIKNIWEWDEVTWEKCNICNLYHSNRKIPQEYWNREWGVSTQTRYKVGIILLRSDQNVLITESYNNCYGFPKGEKDFGESIHDCAKREFKEETGESIDFIDLNKCDEVVTSIENINYVFYVVRVSNFFKLDKFPVDDVEITSFGWININDLSRYKLSKAIRKIYNIYMNGKRKKECYYNSQKLYNSFKRKKGNFVYYNKVF